jgi:hypothetical protein
LTDGAREDLAFRKYWPDIQMRLTREIPARFDPMPRTDQAMFGQQVFHLCHKAELLMDDEIHFVAVAMTLFGHHFIADPRFFPLASLLFDQTHSARLRRARPMIAPLMAQVWGQTPMRQDALAQAAVELNALQLGHNTSGAFAPCEMTMEMFGRWQPSPLDQAAYVAHAKAVQVRLAVQGPQVLDVCFWAVWALGVDFDHNPQHQWWIRSLDKVGPDPARRYHRLLGWLERLARGSAVTHEGEMQGV